ncbi:MAG TPA: MFS transporter [Pseudonocardiaceae bacterium]|nr:MFS transporter [Pseudonocardiaceae bacterium]
MHLTEKCRALLPTIQAEWAATELAADALEAELPMPLRMVPTAVLDAVDTVSSTTASWPRQGLSTIRRCDRPPRGTHRRHGRQAEHHKGDVDLMDSADNARPRRRLIADLRPLRQSPAFRRLWIGSGISALGGQLTSFALMLQVFDLTRSTAAVGAIGVVSLVPTLVVGLFSGSFADALDRRKLVLIISSGLTMVSAALAVQAYLALDQLWLLYVLAGVQSLLFAINMPARQTFIPRLLPAETLGAGIALNMATFQASLLLGPSLGGLITGIAGLRTCYLIDAVTFLAALYGVARLPAMPPQGGHDQPGLRSVVDGFRFVRRRPVLAAVLLADLNATVLGMPFAVFPAINAQYFGGNPRTLGLLVTAVGAGGLLGSLLTGPVGQVRRAGLGVLVAVACWGAGITGFGLVHVFWIGLVLLAICGAADNISVVLRTLVVQRITPDRYRGRISGVNFVVGMGGPQLGNFEAGLVGSLASPVVSVVSGGLATIVGVLALRLAVPALAHYDVTAKSEEELEQEPDDDQVTA